jgi:hypothetical protein
MNYAELIERYKRYCRGEYPEYKQYHNRWKVEELAEGKRQIGASTISKYSQ